MTYSLINAQISANHKAGTVTWRQDYSDGSILRMTYSKEHKGCIHSSIIDGVTSTGTAYSSLDDENNQLFIKTVKDFIG